MLILLDEMELNPKSNNVNIRTLAMAIVPGQEIVSISVAEETLSQGVLDYISGKVEKNERNVDPQTSEHQNSSTQC